jgi:hypothetical protein
MTDDERELESVRRELREIEERRAVLAWCRCGAHVYECRTMDGPIVVVNENGTRHVCPKPAQV